MRPRRNCPPTSSQTLSISTSCFEDARTAGRVLHVWRTTSQVKNDIADRTRTADEQVAGRWQVERLRLVSDLSRDETALTIMADAGPARPAHRDVARLREFQHALVGRRIPVGGYAAPRERDQRAVVGVKHRQMRCLRHSAGDPRRQGLAAVKDLDANTIRPHTEVR